jgi:hypothetical protein
MRNRIIRQGKQGGRDEGAPFLDVTPIALECRFPFTTRVSRQLLNAYTLPDIGDDAEGRILVAYLLDEILAAICEQLPATSISYGDNFAIFFEFVAQPRQRLMPEILDLCAWFSPWAPDPEVYVWILSQTDDIGSAGKGRF